MCERWVSTVRRAEEELLADLGVRVPESDQAQDVELALAEVVELRCGHVGFDGDACTERGVQVDPASGDDPDGRHELGARRPP